MNNSWRVVRTDCDDGALSIEDEDGITICELAFTGGDEETVARTIAAAPRLHSACCTHGICPATTKWIAAASSKRQPRGSNEEKET